MKYIPFTSFSLFFLLISIGLSDGMKPHYKLGATRLKDGTIKQECKSDGFYGNEQDCKKFFRCVSESPGSAKFKKYDFVCPAGTIYDPSIVGCNYLSSVTPIPKCKYQPEESDQGQGQANEENNLIDTSATSEILTRSEVLKEGIYTVDWQIDFKQEMVEFETTVKTKGFVGFGLSYTGSMVGADIVIGGILPNGTAYFTDRYATEFALPTIDAQQDWIFINGRENETHTVLRFSRKLNTCDLQDIPINNDTIKIIWSYGKSDAIGYHGTKRGNLAVNLLDLPTPEPDITKLQTWRISQPVQLSANDTTYWCTFFKGPEILKKHHVVGFNIYLNGEESKTHTHHADLYKCTPPVRGKNEFFEKFLGYGYDCYFSKEYVPVEHCSLFEFQWTIGGRVTMFPDDIGVPIGEESVEYYMTEIHFNNPDELEGLTVESGFEFYYTEKLRTHEAGFIQVGAQTAKTFSLTIPPNSVNFVHTSHCSPHCTANLPAEGINVFVYLLHSHLSGRKERLRHFRGNQELPWIANDEHFDFSYQTNRPLRTHVKLLPGDQLTLECTYDTTWKNGGATLGGRSPRDEMCQTFLMYYPRVSSINQCGSDFSQKSMLEFMGIENVSAERGIIDPTILAPPHLKGLKYSKYVENKVEWTPEVRAEFQNMTRFGIQETYCFAPAPIVKNGVLRIQYPNVQKQFTLPEQC